MIRVLAYALLGAALFWFSGIAAILTIGELVGVSQREGSFAMGVVFGLGPILALVGLVLGGVFGFWRARRARAAAQG